MEINQPKTQILSNLNSITPHDANKNQYCVFQLAEHLQYFHSS